MATPTLRTAGTAVFSTSDPAVPYPATVNAGDMLLMFVCMSQNSSITTPSGWTLKHTATFSIGGNTAKMAVFDKDVVIGSESGTQTVATGSGQVHGAQMIGSPEADSFEGFVDSNYNSSNLQHPSVTTTGADRRILIFAMIDDNVNAGAFTGETGGTDLTMPNNAITSTGSDLGISIHTGDAPTARTVAAGTYALGSTERQLVIGFAIYTNSTTDELLGDDIEADAEVTDPAIGQTHEFLATDIEGASEAPPATIGQIHNLPADDTEAAAEVTAPALSESHTLLGDDIEGASEAPPTTLGQVHALLADNSEGASETTPAAIGQVHALPADNTEGASEAAPAAIGQVHALPADGIEGASETTPATIGQIHALFGDGIEGASEVTPPTLAVVVPTGAEFTRTGTWRAINVGHDWGPAIRTRPWPVLTAGHEWDAVRVATRWQRHARTGTFR